MKQETIFNTPFSYLKELAEYIFETTEVGSKITNPQIRQTLKSVYDKHPWKPDILEPYDLIVKRDKWNKRKCFAIISSEGKCYSFSLKHSLKNRSVNIREYLLENCRNIVSADIFKKRENIIKKHGLKCQKTNQYLPRHELHLHHESPYEFNIICDLFLLENNLRLDASLFESNDNGELQFKNSNVTKLFRQFHQKFLDQHVCLISKKINLKSGTRFKFQNNHQKIEGKIPFSNSISNSNQLCLFEGRF